ncbi:MAG: hypothetical protein XE11_1052 [Methanomicrobiales archaeon 53_19]|jgi:hypothetical protein|nr:MAG: hypothetical protein XE11_1052 [Methanomicrobiales archaeon 53_19]
MIGSFSLKGEIYRENSFASDLGNNASALSVYLYKKKEYGFIPAC